MSTKKRVNRKQGFRFTLLHRSQQDPLYHDEEHGSKLILHPADRRTAEAMEKGSLKQEGALNYVSRSAVTDSPSQNKTGTDAGDSIVGKKRKQDMGAIREYREVDEYGLPLDGYDYSKHLSAVGGGAFISTEGVRIERAVPLVAREVEEVDVLQMIPETVFASANEQPRFLEAITLRPEGMDEDMKRQLGLADEEEGDDAESAGTGEWGDLADDFMAQIIAGGAPAEEEEEEEEGEEQETRQDLFDFDAHVQRLMKEAEEEEDEEDEDEEDEFDAFARRKREGGANDLIDRKPRDVDAHFEAVLAAEYDDEEDDERGEDGEEHEDETFEEEGRDEEMSDVEDDDEMDQEDEEDEQTSKSQSTRRHQQVGHVGRRQIEQDDPVFLQAINEFLERKASDASLGDVAHPPPAAETLRLVAKNEEPVKNETVRLDEGEEEEGEEIEADEPPTYEEFLEMWGTYKVTQKPQFDCQTIVSTRSTTDNLPSQIIVTSRKSKKKSSSSKQEELEEPIKEDGNENNDDNDDAETVESITRDVARLALQSLSERSRNETPADRKARKAKLKELKRDRRAEKKQVKEAFKSEKVKVVNAMTARGAPLPGVSEFKI